MSMFSVGTGSSPSAGRDPGASYRVPISGHDRTRRTAASVATTLSTAPTSAATYHAVKEVLTVSVPDSRRSAAASLSGRLQYASTVVTTRPAEATRART